MKYSIILPYYRRPELKDTLQSFDYKYTGREDFEVIIIEDSKNASDDQQHTTLMNIINEFKERLTVRHYIDDFVSFNPAHKYNLGFTKSSGQYIVLSSPEVIHESDILDGFDTAFCKDNKSYIVCSCKAVEDGKFLMWYQNSIHRNVLFHFCSAMSRENFIKIGGFDESYCKGIGFEDEDLVARIIGNGIKIIPRDDLITIHVEHSREYIDKHRELVEVNRSLYLSRYGVRQ
jgi:hypothetical protein